MLRRFTIGRDRQCDVPVADESVSRRHDEIWLADDGSLMITDLPSSNGTKLVRDGTAAVLSESAVQAGDQAARVGSESPMRVRGFENSGRSLRGMRRFEWLTK